MRVGPEDGTPSVGGAEEIIATTASDPAGKECDARRKQSQNSMSRESESYELRQLFTRTFRCQGPGDDHALCTLGEQTWNDSDNDEKYRRQIYLQRALPISRWSLALFSNLGQ